MNASLASRAFRGRRSRAAAPCGRRPTQAAPASFRGGGALTAAVCGLLLPLGALTAWAADEFLTNLHKADHRAEPDERIEYFSRAIRTWRTSHGPSLLAHCLFNRGEAYLHQARLGPSETDLTKAISLDPGNPLALLLRGRLFLRTGRIREAEHDFREFVSLKPDDVTGRVLLGESRERAGRRESALRDYRRASHSAPEDWRPCFGLARVLMAGRQYKQAHAMLDKAEAITGTRHPAVRTLRGKLLAETLRFKEALEELGEGITLYEKQVTELQRSAAGFLDLEDGRDALSSAYHARGGVHEKTLAPGPALSDYREGCRLGHKPSCLKAEELAQIPLTEKAAPPAPPPPPKKEPPKKAREKKRRLPKPKSDPGPRIYGS